jgi:O-antigen/teichoic acid export membrane protein
MPAGSETKRKQIYKNAVYNSVSWLLPVAMGFIVTPIVVNRLGYESYGVYAVILGFIGSSFTFHVGRTVAKYIAEFRAAGETSKIAEVLSATLWIGLAIGFVGAVVSFFAARFIVSDVLQIETHLRESAIVSVYLAGLTILITNISLIFQYALQGLQRFDRLGILTGFSGFILSLGSIIIVVSGRGVIELFVWNLVVITLVGLCFYVSVRRLLPEFFYTFHIQRGIWKAALVYSASVIAYQVCGNIIVLFERVWIVRSFGPEVLTFYVVPLSIGIYIHSFVNSLVAVLFPVFNGLLQEKDRPRLNDLYKQATKFAAALIWFFVTSAAVGGESFLTLWIGADFAQRSISLLAIHLISFGLLANILVIWHIVESFGQTKLNALSTLIWLFISVPLMIFLSAGWQAEGIAAARLIGLACTLPLFLYAEKKLLGRSYWPFWIESCLKIGTAAAILYFIEATAYRYFTASWPTLVATFLIGGAAYWLVLVATRFITREDTSTILGIIFKRFQK